MVGKYLERPFYWDIMLKKCGELNCIDTMPHAPSKEKAKTRDIYQDSFLKKWDSGLQNVQEKLLTLTLSNSQIHSLLSQLISSLFDNYNPFRYYTPSLSLDPFHSQPLTPLSNSVNPQLHNFLLQTLLVPIFLR